MELGKVTAKLLAQVADGQPVQIGTIEIPVAAGVQLDGELVQKLVTDGANRCVNHNPVQHRDGKPPWCNTCKEQ